MTINQSSQLLVSSRLASIDAALQRIFVNSQEETLTSKARGIMGELIAELTDEDLEIYITEFQHLINYWFDRYERKLFDGQTLRQILGIG